MFWKNFLSLCEKIGQTPNGVAKALGMASGSVTEWKNGRVPRWQTIEKIANYFGINPQDLISSDEKKPPEKEVLPEGLEDLAELYAKLTPEMRETMAALLSSLGELPEDRQQFVVQAVRLALGRQ